MPRTFNNQQVSRSVSAQPRALAGFSNNINNIPHSQNIPQQPVVTSPPPEPTTEDPLDSLIQELSSIIDGGAPPGASAPGDVLPAQEGVSPGDPLIDFINSPDVDTSILENLLNVIEAGTSPEPVQQPQAGTPGPSQFFFNS